jgi:hypothetical protein
MLTTEGTSFWYFLRSTMRIVNPRAVISWFRPPIDRLLVANGKSPYPKPRRLNEAGTLMCCRPRDLHNLDRCFHTSHTGCSTPGSLRRCRVAGIIGRFCIHSPGFRERQEAICQSCSRSYDLSPYHDRHWSVHALVQADSPYDGHGYWRVW